ncbi:non-specific lipid transfer protein GPI-anchored 5 isoform X2 [Nicotiana tabacum]|uniref:Non-specific lipid transfer protein GPI-anchored 5 isoform X2 n=1 Tax=Nicotiana tabacum TaxID=4097 RepID=A0A1S3ZI72_TOBAC|nr:protein YLS3-like isoform X2 [Nicotiana tomentosiformis]XP_016464138.1 PREDICTED: protein YLS3-like isoform X2 [Nicotiana tabacum]
MTSKINVMALVIILVAFFGTGALAQSSCMTTLVSLSPCLNYVSGNSSTPSSSCCTALSSVVQSNPQCLCVLVNGGGSNLGIAINQTLALALPSACNLQTPPVSQCNAANGPTASAAVPASSPTGSTTPSDSSNELPTTPSGSGSTVPTGATGSKTVPSTPGSSSAENNSKISISLVGFLLFTASFASTFRGF